MAETRDQILRAASALFAREGMTALSMRRIASELGLSATAIYRHFDGKEALIAAVATEGFECFGRYLMRGLEGDSPRDRLRRTGMAYCHFGLEEEHFYRVMFMSSAADLGLSTVPESLTQAAQPTFQLLVDRVSECQVDGWMEAGDPIELAATIWAHTHGLLCLYLTGRMEPAKDGPGGFTGFYQRSVERMLRGLERSAR